MTGRELYERFCSVNYVRNGRDAARDGGLDCWGFVRQAWEILGMPVPPEYVIDDEELRSRAFRDGRESGEWERLPVPSPWCLCLLKHPAMPEHCGIVTPDCLHIVHCNKNGVHLMPLDSILLKTYAKSYYNYSQAR